MKDYYLSLLVNSTLTAFALISIWKLIYNKSSKGLIVKRIYWKGWLLILFALSSVCFNFLRDRKSYCDQQTTNSDLQQSQEELVKLQLSIKDSIKEAIDMTYLKYTSTTHEALAKYNLEIKDSLKSVVNKLEIDAVNPQLSLPPIDEESVPAFLNDEKDQLKIQFISEGGTSYNILIDCYIIKRTSNIPEILSSDRISFGDVFLLDISKKTMQMFITPEVLEYTELTVYLTGTFSKDPLGKYIIEYDQAFLFNFKENKFIHKISLDLERWKKGLKIE